MLAGLAAAVVATLYFAMVRPNARELARLHRRYEARSGAYSHYRYVRPVLRGRATNGNAFVAQTRALTTLGSIPDEVMDGLGETLASGGAPTPAALRFLRAHGEGLAQLRESTQREWSLANAPPRPRATVPDILPRAKASLLLVAEASTQSPAECMAETADAVRVLQDAAAGLGLLGVVAPSFVLEPASRVALGCAALASVDERRVAFRELVTLASTAPPLHRGLELETLRDMAMADALAASAGPLPSPRRDAAGALHDRYVLVDALEEYDRSFDEVRALGFDDVPHALTVIGARDRRVAASTNPLLAAYSSPWRPHLERAAVALARLHAWTLAVGLVDDADLASDESTRTVLKDPFAEGRLHVTRDADGSVVVWSVGPNGRDDQAAEGSDDIRVELRLRPTTDAEPEDAPRP